MKELKAANNFLSQIYFVRKGIVRGTLRSLPLMYMIYEYVHAWHSTTSDCITLDYIHKYRYIYIICGHALDTSPSTTSVSKRVSDPETKVKHYSILAII